MQKTVHIIGAGISGLSAAVRLANANYRVHVHEATQAGRRPLPVLFRRRHQSHHRQRQPSAAVRQPPCAGLRPLDRHRGGAGRAEARAVSVCRYLDRPALAARSRRRPVAALGVRRSAPRPRYQPARLSRTGAADLGRHRTSWSATPSPAKARCTSGWCSRCCWPRSTSIRPRARPGLAGAIVRETLLAGGQACRPLIARDGLSAVLIEPADQAAAGQGRHRPVRP